MKFLISMCVILAFGINSKAQSFTEVTGGSNPLNGVDVGSRSKPTLIDIDGDGDFDVFIGEFDGVINYYENTGTTSSPIYTVRTGGSNPFNGVDVGGKSTLGFVDIDNDGDKDAFIGETNGNYNFYRNDGTSASPSFTLITGGSNPLNGFTVSGPSGQNNSDVSFADLDGDGDWDAIGGEGNGLLHYYENTGTISSPVFTERTGASNPMNGEDVGQASSPHFVDVDSDGDWDLFVGNEAGTISYFENTGTSASPAYTERTGASNPMDGFDVGGTASITYGDINGDGDSDAFVGEQTGTINYFTGTDIGGVPLPVVLLYFTGHYKNSQVYIEWATASETENDYFTLERSSIDLNFYELVRIPGSNYSITKKVYSFGDTELARSGYYYRLKQTDLDGSFEYSTIIFVQTDLESPLGSVYPNPSSTIFNVIHPLANSVILRNPSGQMLLNSKLVNEKTVIEATSFPRGIYYLEFETPAGKEIIEVILK